MIGNYEHLLTIVTVNKDNAVGVKRTINSLKNLRDDKRIQFCFIDGNSVDNSIEIAKKHYRIDEIICEPDNGVYDAMNKGLLHSKGEYVLWLNSGDEIICDKLYIALEKVQNSLHDIVSFGLEMWEEHSKDPKIVWIPKEKHLPDNTFPHGTTFFRKEKIKEIGGYSLKYKIASDRDAILRLYRNGAKIKCYNDVIGRFYMGGLSSSDRTNHENISINYNHGLIGKKEYIKNFIRYYVKSIVRKNRE
jgi:glycosyltransferase involved in cell wall biosynthesis